MDITWEFILRIFVAAMLGGAIGLEREYRAKEAGLRTHFLVALGSALFMIVSAYGFSGIELGEEQRWDIARIAAQVVTGIGFIGAGLIIKNKYDVSGLTTAASIFATSIIGIAVGVGLIKVSVIVTVIVTLVLASSFLFHEGNSREIALEKMEEDEKNKKENKQ